MNDQVAEIKSKVDIASIIGERIELKRAGRNYKANCPFHGEKTPSFMVSPELQIFKCFGCGESGDAFSFLEKFEGMEFPEALKYLADKVGVQLQKTKFSESNEREQLIEIINQTLKFYQYMLLSHPLGEKAKNYLVKDRGLTLETIKEFKLGFSPENSYIINNFLMTKKKFDLKDIEKSGIGVPREKNFYAKGEKYSSEAKNFYDRFNGRVIFPLFDHRSNPIGFSGRILPWDKRDTGKYINSPETPIYHKSNVLYGLNLTRQFIKKKKIAIVVEGELDLISSYQAGIKNIVAIKGSALTEEQVRLLSRFAQKFILALDSDMAGDAAARRGLTIATNLGIDVKVAKISGYKDPDEAARNGLEGYKKDLINSESAWDFLIDSVFSRFDSRSGSGKAKISKELAPMISAIEDKIVQAHYINVIAKKLDVPAEAVSGEVARIYKNDSTPIVSIISDEKKTKDRKQILEDRVLVLSLISGGKEFLSQEVENLFASPFNKRILEELTKFMSKNRAFNLSEFTKTLPEELSVGFSEMVLSESKDLNDDPDALKKELDLVLKELKIQKVKENLKSLAAEMRSLEASGEKEKLLKAQNKFNNLAKRLSGYEEGDGGGIIFDEG